MKYFGILALSLTLMASTSCKKKNKNDDPTTPPTITLNGSNPMQVGVGDTYNDPGATAKDALGATVSVKTDESNVNTSQAGSYQVVYTAEDCYSNTAQKSRTVNVVVTAANWAGNWNVSHDVKTSLGQNLIKNTCAISEAFGIVTLDHDGQVVNGSISGQNITINTSRVTINAGLGKYDLSGTGTINDAGDEIVINYNWDGVCGTCLDGSGTATYTKQ